MPNLPGYYGSRKDAPFSVLSLPIIDKFDHLVSLKNHPKSKILFCLNFTFMNKKVKATYSFEKHAFLIRDNTFVVPKKVLDANCSN